MRKILLGLSLGLCTVFGSSCAGYKAPFMPPTGAIFASGSAPLSLDHDQTPVETAATGSSSTLFVCVPFTYGALSFAWDDASVKTAAAKGGVGKVQYADYEYFQVLGFFGRMTVHAHGEKTAH
jgi:hypothetical protein